MKVVVGLGNPGSKYTGTRHNIGYEVVDYLAQGSGVGLPRVAFQSVVAEMATSGEKVLLVKPETYMNLSGRAVRAILDFYKLSAADFLIICDDLNLPVGKIRVRGKGSAGGQNGLKNIQDQLGTDEYPRLRVGVGQPNPGEAVDYVLGRFKPGERPVINDAVARSAAAVMLWVNRGLEACMNSANGSGAEGDDGARKKKPKPEKPAGKSPPKVSQDKPNSDEVRETSKPADGSLN